jgi:thiamine pyrophosphate-dependent acetolactate synthase large subunit-like protein
MKRYTAIRDMIRVLSEADVAIFSGKEICKEAFKYDRPGYFYMEEYFGISVSFALGVALSTDKRVFLFVGEGDIIRDLSALGQAAVSKCKNLFIIVLDNGCYQELGNLPNLFNSLLSRKGLFFNLGFMVHDFTVSIKNRYLVEIRAAVERIRGPMVILITVDRGINKKLEPIDIELTTRIETFMEFINNTELETALYVPPIWLTIPEQEIKSINIGEITGGIN